MFPLDMQAVPFESTRGVKIRSDGNYHFCSISGMILSRNFSFKILIFHTFSILFLPGGLFWNPGLLKNKLASACKALALVSTSKISFAKPCLVWSFAPPRFFTTRLFTLSQSPAAARIKYQGLKNFILVTRHLAYGVNGISHMCHWVLFLICRPYLPTKFLASPIFYSQAPKKVCYLHKKLPSSKKFVLPQIFQCPLSVSICMPKFSKLAI